MEEKKLHPAEFLAKKCFAPKFSEFTFVGLGPARIRVRCLGLFFGFHLRPEFLPEFKFSFRTPGNFFFLKMMKKLVQQIGKVGSAAGVTFGQMTYKAFTNAFLHSSPIKYLGKHSFWCWSTKYRSRLL